MQIMPERYKEGLRCYDTDRRDFYHQFATTRQRSLTNVVYPLIALEEFKGVRAYGDCVERFKRRPKADREEQGDYLHGHSKGILVSGDTLVAPSFAALFQGDHLGVEVACSAYMCT